jgi:hypothetical protein
MEGTGGRFIGGGGFFSPLKLFIDVDLRGFRTSNSGEGGMTDKESGRGGRVYIEYALWEASMKENVQPLSNAAISN